MEKEDPNLLKLKLLFFKKHVFIIFVILTIETRLINTVWDYYIPLIAIWYI